MSIDSRTTSAAPSGTTWYVTTTSDSVTDGNLATHSGSLRFVLAHATNGDFVSFAQYDAESAIRAGSTLTVPVGVTVGHTRNEACGNVTTPLVNVQAINTSVNPVFSLSADSTLRNIDIGGGYNTARITGANVDVCGVGLGIVSSGDSNYAPPYRAALIVDGDHAVIHRNTISSFIVVGTHGSDSRIGDTLDGSGDSNKGLCSTRVCGVTVFADSLGAPQRVTIRDAFARGLAGMPGNGILGGDDVITHANNWAGTPDILSAYTYDHFATVIVTGTANPLSLVDIYFDNHIALTRQIPVTANAAGIFNFTGALPGSSIWVIAVSTLDDPAHPNRVGSSSEFSNQVQVAEAVATTTSLQLTPAELTYSAVASGPIPPAQYLSVTAPSISPTLAWQTNVTTTDGLNWLDATPLTGNGDGTISVTVDSTGLMTGTYQGTVTVFDPADPADQATASVTLNVTEPPFYGVTLTPQQAAQSGDPGATVAYTLRITNTGSTIDTFTVTPLGNIWTTTAPATIGPLASGKGANLTVNVDVPPDAVGDATDMADIIVTSQGDPAMWATAELTTTANALYGVVLEPPMAEQSGDAGTPVTYTLQVTNIGNTMDTFAVAVTGNAWAITLPATIGPLASGASETLTITVDIPSDASNTATDTVMISVTSQSDPSQWANALLTTTANALYGVTLEPSMATQFGDAGMTVTYTLRVTNTGILTDALTLGYSGNTWDVDLSMTQTELLAGEGVDVMVYVSIPVTATGGMTDAVQLTVTGTGVSDTGALITAVNFKAYLPLVVQDYP